MKICYIMQGAPGSGKTTQAKMIQYFHNMNSLGAIAVHSTDELWYENGIYKFDPTKLGSKHLKNQRHAKKSFERGWDVIIDNTNIKRKDAKPYLDMAREMGYSIQVIRVDPGVEVCVARQQERSSDRRVPEEVIRRMYSQMEELL